MAVGVATHVDERGHLRSMMMESPAELALQLRVDTAVGADVTVVVPNVFSSVATNV